MKTKIESLQEAIEAGKEIRATLVRRCWTNGEETQAGPWHKISSGEELEEFYQSTSSMCWIEELG